MTRSSFEQYAREYDAWFERHPVEYRAEVEAIRALLPAQGGTGVTPRQTNLPSATARAEQVLVPREP